jgi:ABC-type transport system substrate-binding protein
MLLTANRDCWEGAPKCEGLDLRFITDQEEARMLFENGELDILDLDEVGNSAEFFIHGDIYQPLLRQGPRVGIAYVALNEAIEPLDDVRVRRAMQLALDRDSIMRVACNGRGSVENGILPRGLIGHNPVLPEIPFDQEWAKRLLTEAGFEAGFELPMVMPDTANQSMRDVMNLLIFMWRRVGIYARVAYVSEEEFIEQRSAGQIACYAATWSADFNDPDNFMYTFFGSQANTRRHGLCYGNAGEMARVASARSIVNEADRVAEYQALEQAIIQQDAAWIPLYSRQHYFAVSKRVDGFRVSWNGWSSNRYSDVAVLEEQ